MMIRRPKSDAKSRDQPPQMNPTPFNFDSKMNRKSNRNPSKNPPSKELDNIKNRCRSLNKIDTKSTKKPCTHGPNPSRMIPRTSTFVSKSERKLEADTTKGHTTRGQHSSPGSSFEAQDHPTETQEHSNTSTQQSASQARWRSSPKAVGYLYIYIYIYTYIDIDRRHLETYRES